MPVSPILVFYLQRRIKHAIMQVIIHTQQLFSRPPPPPSLPLASLPPQEERAYNALIADIPGCTAASCLPAAARLNSLFPFFQCEEAW